MNEQPTLLRSAQERSALWQRVAEISEAYVAGVRDLPVTPPDLATLRAELDNYDFTQPVAPLQALEAAADLLTRYTVHTPHPRYFGLFNPAPSTMGIMADALVATFNPQLAAWSHAPFAVSLEAKLVRDLGRRFGIEHAYGAFTSGGAEANTTALLCALAQRYPEYGELGVSSIKRPPAIYAGPGAHHSIAKAARSAGIGMRSVRTVSADASGKMDISELHWRIAEDIRTGFTPLMIVATAGATSTGIIDPLSDASDVAREHDAWLHVDGAWGGFAALVPELRGFLNGIERADSITFDPHKMLSVPMGAGLFLTPHRDLLGKTFGISTTYMPAASQADPDPYTHSMQWSRRFIGLKVFLTLVTEGWDGYANVLRRQTAMADYLLTRLLEDRWIVENDTPLPVVCFRRPTHDAARISTIAQEVASRGHVWISITAMPNGTPVLRACITNYRTSEHDVDALLDELRGE